MARADGEEHGHVVPEACRGGARATRALGGMDAKGALRPVVADAAGGGRAVRRAVVVVGRCILVWTVFVVL